MSFEGVKIMAIVHGDCRPPRVSAGGHDARRESSEGPVVQLTFDS